MLGVTVFVLIYWLNPPGNAWLDNVSLIAIGFLIYGPVMLIGLQALDYVLKSSWHSSWINRIIWLSVWCCNGQHRLRCCS